MSAYDLDTVLKKWESGDLTTEQAVGQVLLLLQEVTTRIGLLEKRQEAFRLELKPVKPPPK